MNDRLSEHLLMSEVIFSATATRLGIDNTPNATQVRNLAELATNIFEPLRKGLGNRPIHINSAFRSEALNRAVGGARNSQHLGGMAMDISTTGYPDAPTNLEIFNYIKNNLQYCQLINEFPDSFGNPKWVHVSYDKDNIRKDILVSKSIEGKTRYENFI